MSAGEHASGDSKRVKVRKIRAYCARCRHRQSFEMTTINHPAHLMFTILTGGLWGISWAAHTIGMIIRPWRCKHCGWHKPDFKE
ncbi:MAG: hypothetical protein WCH43_04755 [Verrucomicrobiota bacterium]